MRRTRRNRDGIQIFQAGMFMMGVSCLIRSLSGGVPMPLETHGGAMHTIPAELWSIAVIGVALWAFLAAEWDALWNLVFSGIFGAVIYIALWYFAGYAAFGFLLSLGSGVIGLLYSSIAVAAALDIACVEMERRLAEFARKVGK